MGKEIWKARAGVKVFIRFWGRFPLKNISLIFFQHCPPVIICFLESADNDSQNWLRVKAPQPTMLTLRKFSEVFMVLLHQITSQQAYLNELNGL